MTSLQTYFDPWWVLGTGLAAVILVVVWEYRKQLKFVLKSLSRNKVRSVLTSMAVFVLVFVVTLIWTILWFLDNVTREKAADFKAIVTEKWQLPSQMPYSYERALAEGAASRPGDVKPTDSMSWSFYGGTLDPAKMTRENIVFFFVMEPRKLLTMMDDLDQLQGEDKRLLDEGIKLMERDKRNIVVGQEKLKGLNKRVGESVKVTSMNYKGIDLEFNIVGTFPKGRYDQSAVMNKDYLLNAMDDWKRKNNGVAHPMANKSLNLMWLKVPDTETFRRVGDQITSSSLFSSPAVKIETASSGVSSFLDAYRDLLWGMRWLLVPAILVTMAMVISNAISISVRERRTEMAVLKVLGYGPNQILAMVLGEALLLGVVSGAASSGLTYLLINNVIGGVKFPIAFFPAFMIPADALWWGPMIGAVTAFTGSIVPAWSARSVKVSEVFSKIA
jgi:putative ABC transport system permease protein